MMAEGYITLFQNEPDGNKPHFKGFIKIDGVDHEFALWPAKEGKKGYSGKYKPRTAREVPPEAQQGIQQLERKAGASASVLSDEIPFSHSYWSQA
jgi:hypothetical protein